MATSARLASASALISDGEGCGGSGPVGLARTAGAGSLATGRGGARRPAAVRRPPAIGSGAASSRIGSPGGGEVVGVVAADAVGEAEAVDLADHRVAGDAAELLGDLARALALGPHGLEGLDLFIGPGHFGHAPFGRGLLFAGEPGSGGVGDQSILPGGGVTSLETTMASIRRKRLDNSGMERIWKAYGMHMYVWWGQVKGMARR